jgi:glycosyltransferase involved in cell wall biosynthesis
LPGRYQGSVFSQRGKSVKISIDGSLLHRKVTGSERYTHNLFSNLTSVGPENEYTIYTRSPVYSPGELAENAFERAFSLKRKMILSDFLWRNGPKTDLYHMTWFGDHYIDLLPLCLSPISALTVLDLMLFRYPSYFPTEAEHKEYQRRCRLAIGMADAIIAISEHTKSDILSNFDVKPARVSVVPLGVDTRSCELGANEAVDKVKAKYGLRKPFILYVATDYPHKNHKNLIKAFHHLVREKKISAQLVFVGTQYYNRNEAELRKLIADCALDDDVIWLDHVEDSELNALYNGSNLFVYPSLDEGFGLPILEAMACGTPVAASRAASIPEVAGDAALLFDPTDISDISNSIETLWNNQRLRRELVERGHERCAELTWEKSAEKTLAVYREAKEMGKSKAWGRWANLAAFFFISSNLLAGALSRRCRR